MQKDSETSGWLTTTELSGILKVSERAIRKQCTQRKHGEYQKTLMGIRGPEYRIHINSPLISNTARMAFLETQIPENGAASNIDPSVDADIYSSSPDHARRKADKYLVVLQVTEGLYGNALRKFIAEWNEKHPDKKTSYPRIMDARKIHKEAGVTGLLGQWGKNEGHTSVPDDLFAYFKPLYMKEGSPGASICHKITLGYAINKDPNFTADMMPSVAAFKRRLEREVLRDSIRCARKGAKAYNREDALHLKRNMDDVLAGVAWVADHAQIDIAVSYKDDQGREKYAFPWVTAWRDFKSGKWVGWDVHIDDPNSDHIFMAAFRGIRDHGKPLHFYLDNGKDFRAKDFSGGKRTGKVSVDEINFRSLVGVLQIDVIFAWPYNPQSKPIERDFLRNKEWLSKCAVGYRGGNVVERPESLNKLIKDGKIETFDDLRKVFDVFVKEVINRAEITQGYRKGKCPDQIWEEEAPIAAKKENALGTVTTDALKLMCCRTSGDIKVTGRGVHDSKLGVDYYSDQLMAYKGQKVYLRRDINSFQEAWVFLSSNNDFIDKAYLLRESPGLARTDVQRSELAEDIALKRRAQKIVKSFMAAEVNEVSLEEKVKHMAAATKLLNDARGYKPGEPTIPTNIIVTQMDRVLSEDKRMQKIGENDFSSIIDANEVKNTPEDDFDVWQAWAM
jgi:putative transposase